MPLFNNNQIKLKMKRTALGFFGRKIYSNKIKSYENKYLEIYLEDWGGKLWEDYAKDCFKLENETKELILNSTGSQRMEYVCGLQALYNIREKELNYVEEKVRKMAISEFKYFFESEYQNILKDLKEKDLKSALELYSEFGIIANSKEIQKHYKWKYVSACLLIFAVEEAFGNELNKIELNFRSL
jgi:hypothetical protein